MSAGDWLLILTFGGPAIVVALYAISIVFIAIPVLIYQEIESRLYYRRVHRDDG